MLRGEQLRVAPLQAEASKAIRGPLGLLMGAVMFVLLIAVGNVAAVLLARASARREEYAVRVSLGAGSWALTRTAVLEAGLLTSAGLLLGVWLAWGLVRFISGRVSAAGLSQLEGLELNTSVLVFGLALGAGVGTLCAVVPAWNAMRTDPRRALQSAARGSADVAGRGFLRNLIVVEVALSLVLLLGAGLVTRGFLELTQRDPGFDPDRLLTLTVDIPSDGYPDGRTVDEFLTPTLEALEAVPGVERASFISLVPYVEWGRNFNIIYEGQEGVDPTELPLVESRLATPSYFATVGQTLLAGRLLDESDGQGSGPPVVIANRALETRDFPEAGAVGQRFRLNDGSFATIVGVVSDVRNAGPVSHPQPAVYWPAQAAQGSTSFPLLIRTASADPASLAGLVTEAIHSIDRAAAISGLRPMEQVIAASVGRPRFYLWLLGLFGGVALLLAMAGLYGVTSYSVARRRREIGVRAALGSTAGSTAAGIVREGMRAVLAGTVIGLAGGWMATKLLTGLLYGVSPLDEAVWIGATAALMGTCLVALLVPAWRAGRISPVIAMRE